MDLDVITVDEIVTLSKDDAHFEEKCASLANCVKDDKCTITQLVNDLGPLLTSTVIDDREKGSLILSLVISYLPDDVLSSTQLNFIGSFYTDRLNDHHQVVPAIIKGLTPLISSRNIPEGLSTQLLNSLLQHVPCQQQQLSDRYNIYKFIKTLLDKRKDEMRAMGLDLVYGVISTIENERDPRNLLYLFNWLPDFLKTIDLGQLTEEMFEVMSCYFPVDFRPPAQDENKITRENLAVALCPCLCAIPSFSEFCIPLALEKLESELRIAKLDSLDLLLEGCKTFPVDTYKRHSSGIWSAIQKEVFNCRDKEDEELEQKCLLTLSSLLRKISIDTEYLRRVAKDIIDTLKGNLRPDAILFVPSSKLIRCISEASSQTAEFVFKETSALLINLYNITVTHAHKATILKQLVHITFTYLSLNSGTNMEESENIQLIPSICLKAMIDVEPEIRSTGIFSLSYLAAFIPMKIRDYFYQNLSTLIVLRQEPIVREAIITSLKTYAELYNEEVQKVLESIQTNGLESLKLYLEAIGSVVTVEQLMPFSLSILVANTLKTFEISIIAIEILRNKLKENELIIYKYLIEDENIVEKMIDFFLENLNNLNIESHEKFLDDITNVLIIVIRNLDENLQDVLIKKQLEKIQIIEKSSEFVVIILFGLLTSLRSNVKIQIDIDQIINITLQAKSSYICRIGSQLLANAVNKSLDENTLLSYLNHIEARCNHFLSVNQQIDNVINLIAFVTKALVMQSNPHTSVWVDKLVQLSVNNASAAKAFQIMLDDNYESLSTRCYCKRKLLYKQRFFSDITTYLVTNYEEDRKHYLMILGYLLQNVPPQILQLELKKIIRLVMLCLSFCQEEDVLYTVLSTINVIIENKDPLAEDYIQEFLKYYTQLTTYEKSMKIRILAIRGIHLYTQYPLYKLIPLKQAMLMVLGKCLDDKKRLVRKEAVEARSKWFLIDAPM